MGKVVTALTSELQIMGVINITPDSFSDGGKFFSGSRANIDKVIDSAAAMVAEGVQWLDVGGESTRPGAIPISVDTELERVIPVVEALSKRFDTRISVDTSQPDVISLSAKAGASMVNDVRALQVEGALQAAVESQMAVCLMHMQGSPASMQVAPQYSSVVDEVNAFLAARVDAVIAAGVPRSHICIDPGFGFGKSLTDNLQLLDALPQLQSLGCPVLVGFSRKSMLGALTGRAVSEREFATMMLNIMALQRGATLFRVHEIAAAADMINIWQAVQAQRTTN